MQKISISFLSLFYISGCIFAPGLSDQDPSSADIVTRQTTPLDVLANFRYAYKFADSLIYSDVLDSSFIFVSKNYVTSPPTDIIWGRDIDIKTTVGMFRHYDILDLTWGDTLEYSEDSLFATTKLTFQLSLVEGGKDVPTLKGEAFFAFLKKPPGIWRITRWDDLSIFSMGGLMSRLAVNIDPIALIRNTFIKDTPDPAHMVVLAEMGGAESIVCHFREDMRTVNERDVRVIQEIAKTHLNIRANVDAETIRKLLTIKPDMITFVSSDSKISLESQPVDLETYAETIGNLTADLRANDIMSSVLINSDINLVKIASRIELDYVEIDTRPYARSEDLDHQIAELEELNNIVIAANKLGMGVNASGGLNQENLRDISKIQFLEDLIVGDAIVVKSLAIGFEHAVRDFANLI